MISFVQHRFGHPLFTSRQHHIGFRQTQRQRRRLRIGLVGVRDHCRHDRFTHQIHRVLRLIRQMRAPVLHLSDPTVRIGAALPLFIRDLLAFAATIQPTQILLRRIHDPFSLCQRSKVFIPIGSAIFAHDALHGSVGFQSSRVDAHRFASQQTLLFQQSQHEGKHAIENTLGQPLANDRHRGMHRRSLRHGHAQETAQRQAVGAAPSDTPLTVQTLEVSDEEHAKVNPGRNAWTTALLVIGGALLFDELVEACLGEDLIEFCVERMARAGGQFCSGDEQFGLLFLTSSNCHAFLTTGGSTCSINTMSSLTGC